ncbi:MAG: cytochrome C [Gemmataceae bacterium]|nr:cytochrome C [Gemmataceae bacterium]
MREAAHLLRLAAVFAAVLVLFVVVRRQVVPADFGRYGHYRASALDWSRDRPVAHAGRQACEMCHTDQVEVLKQGRHGKVNCEACHGPQAAHAGDPAAVKPARPDPRKLCAGCHEANLAKPKGFPQVVSKEHSGGEDCKSCHVPHNPRFPQEAKP